MTAVNLVAGANAAYLLADGGAYHDDGTILHIGSKIDTCERLRAAIAHSGVVSTTFGLSEWMETQPDQRTLLTGLPEKMRAEVDEIAASWEAYPEDRAQFGPTELKLQLFVAIWSLDREEPQAYVIGSPGCTFGPRYKPWSVARVGEVVQPSTERSLYPPLAAEGTDWALPLIEAQRRTPDERGIHRVGCFAELVTVTEAGINRETIRRWRLDRVGRKVRPGRLLDRLTYR